ncbi:MAG TPA: biopolymer transporter TolR [Verrucomicrobiota bacterium]|nr:biopolymer transporter TolR [Verrucomicrobiota bacterium]
MDTRAIIRPITLIAMTAMLFSMAGTNLAQPTALGQFDGHCDIGQPKLTGSASYDAASQEYTLTAAGTNMWYGTDQFHFVWKKMKGDFILRTRIEFEGKGVDPHRKLGWMVRPNLDADAPYADCAEHGDGLTSLQFRRSKGANTEQIVLPVTNANVLQFERKGNTYIFSAARYGETFVSRELTNFNLGDDVYVGLYLCSHNGDVVEKAKFRDVRIVRPVKEGFTPYRDYIGSVLEILDVHTGKLEMIHRSAQPFEAPNWTTDGKELIYNISGRAEGWGRLARFDLTTRTPTLIDTGTCIKNNNDHVLSFDGTMLAISDQSAPGGQSTIYTLPSSGGTPKRITPLTPSYLHGWSPDAKWLVYTGGRTNKYDIYKIPSEGSGPEIRLTDSPGLNDGPEFSPDGRYIYFNSNRTGKMQIWRMKPDGSEQEQVTNDEFNNWFPHFSPDGKWIVFISFPKDIDSKDHPYYKHCYLQLMPASGGPSKIIAYLYGGQGTINVPSWSPDSTRIAFVSNSAMD